MISYPINSALFATAKNNVIWILGLNSHSNGFKLSAIYLPNLVNAI